MGRLEWYKRNPVKALKGMMMLTLEQRGAYNTVLDLIYSHDGELPDDEHFIAGWCRVDVRVWRRLRAGLMAAGKLYSEGGKLRNATADVEVHRGLSTLASASIAGKRSGEVRAAKRNSQPNKINAVAGTPDATPDELPFEPIKTQNKDKKKRDTIVSPKKEAAGDRRGTRLADDFSVPKEWTDWAVAEQCPTHLLNRAVARFPDYWRSQPGARGVKLDWFATWRNWIRKAMEDDERQAANAGQAQKPTHDDKARAARDAVGALFARPVGAGPSAGVDDPGSAAHGPIIDNADARDLFGRGQAAAGERR